jgi:hypothetical protein
MPLLSTTCVMADHRVNIVRYFRGSMPPLNHLETCSSRGDKMKIIAVITDPLSIRRYLEGIGQSPGIPKVAPARAPPLMEMAYTDCDY